MQDRLIDHPPLSVCVNVTVLVCQPSYDPALMIAGIGSSRPPASPTTLSAGLEVLEKGGNRQQRRSRKGSLVLNFAFIIPLSHAASFEAIISSRQSLKSFFLFALVCVLLPE